ncbi:MAG: ATPase [Clostridia bacterium]|nr:ATPase [Clostridia bacterium]
MSISKMSFISMIGPMDKVDELINICGESGVFEPDNVFSFYSNTENFSAISEENPYAEPLKNLKSSAYSCGKKLKDVDISGFYTSKSKVDRFVNYIYQNIESLVLKKRELYGNLAKYKEEIEKLKHFYGLRQSINEILSCECTKAKFGKMPIDSYKKFEEIAEKSSETGLDLVFFPFDSDAQNQWGIYFSSVEDSEETDRIFSSLYFEEIPILHSDKTPYEQSTYLQNLSTETYKQIEKVDRKIEGFWNSQKSQCMKFYTKLKQLSSYFEIKSYAAKYNNAFILVGWVPQENLEDFKQKISGVENVEYSTEKGEEILNHQPPVKLKNKKIFRPFEFLVDTYGTPSYGEMDPTVFVALTYTILFGIMFADLGQGLLVSLVGFLMWKLKGMNLGKMLIFCGFSSAIFGTFFGSVFGFEHALDPFYKNVFGLKEKPIEVMDASSTNAIIYSAVGLGVLLLIVSMVLGVYSLIKRKNYGEAIFGSKGLCGLTFYMALLFMIADMVALHTGIVNNFYIIFLIIVPLIILMFSEILIKLVNREKNWLPESWGDYLPQSFFELFEIVLSYVTNTMSFLRVGAFVLVHAGMMMVVFTIADMFSGPGYVIAVVIGNLIVTALEALVAGIQVVRLEFYEMFSKFFEGQGRPFTPVKAEDNLV